MNRRTGLGRHTRSDDATGDPLDGLVNLFDIGIVLAVAFLVIGLGFTLRRTAHSASTHASGKLGQGRALPSTTGAPSVSGHGQAVGTVYRLASGQLVLVQKGAERKLGK